MNKNLKPIADAYIAINEANIDKYMHAPYVKGNEFKFMVTIFPQENNESSVWTHLGDFTSKLVVENMEFVKDFREILGKFTQIVKNGPEGSTIITSEGALKLTQALSRAGFRYSKREQSMQITVSGGIQALAILKRALNA